MSVGPPLPEDRVATLDDRMNAAQTRADSPGDAQWLYDPPYLDEYVESRNYLGYKALSKGQRTDAIALLGENPKLIFSGGSNYTIAVNLWGKGGGKDYYSAILQSYIDQVVRCMRDPHSFFTMAPNEDISLINVSLSQDHATNIYFKKFKNCVVSNAWYRDKYSIYEGNSLMSIPGNIKGRPRLNIHSGEIYFTDYKLLNKAFGSDNESAEGGSPIWFNIDEACFDYRQPIVLANGSKKWIGEIVHKKLPVKVLSYNFEKKKIESRKVINWFKYPAQKKFIKIKANTLKNKRSKIILGTPNHHIFTPGGMKRLDQLEVGSIIYGRGLFLSKSQKQLVYGSLLGDANISKSGNLNFVYDQKQVSYLNFKRRKLISMWTGTRNKNKSGYRDMFFKTEDTQEARKIVYKKNKKTVTKTWLDLLGIEGLAFWYLDDGALCKGNFSGCNFVSFCCASLSKKEINIIRRRLNALGYKSYVMKNKRYKNQDRGFDIRFDQATSYRFLRDISKYIPSCMKHKSHYKCTSKAIDDSIYFKEMKVISTEVKKNKTGGAVYDIEVEGNHNYFASDILVSNSAMKANTKLGNADKIYSTLRTSCASRFGKKWKGMIISYPRSEIDFTVRMYELSQAAPTDDYGNTVYGSKRTTWEAREEGAYPLPPFEFEGMLIPGDFRDEFRLYPEESLQKFACRPPAVENPFFTYPGRIFECVKAGRSPLFTTQDCDIQHVIKDTNEMKKYVGKIIDWIKDKSYTTLKMPRVIHVDGGLTNNRAGFALAHGEPIEINIKDRADGILKPTFVNKVIFDAILYWQPNKQLGLQVSLNNIETIINELLGFLNIVCITYDQWNSQTSLETFQAKGIRAIEKTITNDDYYELRSMVYAGGVEFLPEEYEFGGLKYQNIAAGLLLTELKRLKIINGKVDHVSESEGGSKDLADCAAGVTWALNEPEQKRHNIGGFPKGVIGPGISFISPVPFSPSSQGVQGGIEPLLGFPQGRTPIGGIPVGQGFNNGGRGPIQQSRGGRPSNFPKGVVSGSPGRINPLPGERNTGGVPPYLL